MTCTPSDIVVAVDPATLRLLGKVPVAGEPDAIRVVGKKLFVITTTGPTLVALSAIANHPGVGIRTSLGEAVPLGDRANVDAVHTNGQWWVSSPSENRVVVYPR